MCKGSAGACAHGALLNAQQALHPPCCRQLRQPEAPQPSHRPLDACCSQPAATHIGVKVDAAVLVQRHVSHHIAALHQARVAEVRVHKPRKVLLHELQHSGLVPHDLLPARVVCLRVQHTPHVDEQREQALPP